MTAPQNHAGLEEWPLAVDGWRFLCTKDNPMPKNSKGHWHHTNAISDGTCYEGCCDDYKCLDCGHTWREEGPD